MQNSHDDNLINCFFSDWFLTLPAATILQAKRPSSPTSSIARGCELCSENSIANVTVLANQDFLPLDIVRLRKKENSLKFTIKKNTDSALRAACMRFYINLDVNSAFYLLSLLEHCLQTMRIETENVCYVAHKDCISCVGLDSKETLLPNEILKNPDLFHLKEIFFYPYRLCFFEIDLNQFFEFIPDEFTLDLRFDEFIQLSETQASCEMLKLNCTAVANWFVKTPEPFRIESLDNDFPLVFTQQQLVQCVYAIKSISLYADGGNEKINCYPYFGAPLQSLSDKVYWHLQHGFQQNKIKTWSSKIHFSFFGDCTLMTNSLQCFLSVYATTPQELLNDNFFQFKDANQQDGLKFINVGPVNPASKNVGDFYSLAEIFSMLSAQNFLHALNPSQQLLMFLRLFVGIDVICVLQKAIHNFSVLLVQKRKLHAAKYFVANGYQVTLEINDGLLGFAFSYLIAKCLCAFIRTKLETYEYCEFHLEFLHENKVYLWIIEKNNFS